MSKAQHAQCNQAALQKHSYSEQHSDLGCSVAAAHVHGQAAHIQLKHQSTLPCDCSINTHATETAVSWSQSVHCHLHGDLSCLDLKASLGHVPAQSTAALPCMTHDLKLHLVISNTLLTSSRCLLSSSAVSSCLHILSHSSSASSVGAWPAASRCRATSSSCSSSSLFA